MLNVKVYFDLKIYYRYANHNNVQNIFFICLFRLNSFLLIIWLWKVIFNWLAFAYEEISKIRWKNVNEIEKNLAVFVSRCLNISLHHTCTSTTYASPPSPITLACTAFPPTAMRYAFLLISARSQSNIDPGVFMLQIWSPLETSNKRTVGTSCGWLSPPGQTIEQQCKSMRLHPQVKITLGSLGLKAIFSTVSWSEVVAFGVVDIHNCFTLEVETSNS